MPRKQLRYGKGFAIALRNTRAQAATMVLAPGDTEGGPDNRHRGSDQWLYVVSGREAPRWDADARLSAQAHYSLSNEAPRMRFAIRDGPR